MCRSSVLVEEAFTVSCGSRTGVWVSRGGLRVIGVLDATESTLTVTRQYAVTMTVR